MKITSIKEIAAPPDVVWAVTEDVERWLEWSPTMDTIHRVDQGPFDVGSSARVKQPGMPEATWTVTRMSRGESFSWETRVRGMHLIATHDIAPLGSGTRSLLRLEVSGLFTAILWPLMWLPIFRALKQENEGLKRRCEAIHAP